MVLVAVAGGTSPTLGKSIVEAILATGKHEVIIVSRSTRGESSSNQSTENPSRFGAPIRYADYTSIDSLTFALRGVDTLISVLKIVEPGQNLNIHSNLLAACKASNVDRFVMSDWSMNPIAYSQVDALGERADLLRLCQQENSQPESPTSCSTIQIGMFMNYFAQGCAEPTPPQKDDHQDDTSQTKSHYETTANLRDDFMLPYIDIATNRLAIRLTSATNTPTPITLTHILDIGEIIAHSLALPPHMMRGALGLTSQTIPFTHIRDYLSSECGITTIPYQPVTIADCDKTAAEQGEKFQSALAEGRFDLGAFKTKMVAQMVGVYCRNGEGAVVEGTLNRLLEEAGVVVKTRTVEDVLLGAWGRKK